MAQGGKYFGMTITQIAILVGLGAAACLLFGFVGWLAMRGGFQQAPAPTMPPQMTATVFVVPTITPTVTSTPVPYEELIPEGWKQHKTELIEIWLPSNFKTTNEAADQELALIGSNPKTSLYRMSVLISYEPLGTDSLDTYLDTGLLGLDPTLRVVERRKISLNATDAVRMVVEGRVEGIDVNELVYVFQDGGTAWAVIYVAQINEFYEMLPTFEQSIKTFRIVR